MVFKAGTVAAFIAAVVGVSGCAVGVANPATDITGARATINGKVFSNKAGTTRYWLRYGTTTGYGSKTVEQSVEINDDDAHPVSVTLRGLNPNTLYHVQMCVRDSEQPPRDVCGSDQSFRTLNEDSLTGEKSQVICTGSDPQSCFRLRTIYDAYSGPSGESPHGSVMTVASDEFGTEVNRYDVTCLNVQGRRATFGLKAIGNSSPSNVRGWVTDTDGTGSDLSYYEPSNTPATSCPIESPVAPQPEPGTGDYFVRDAQP